jgi:hypothetical protein
MGRESPSHYMVMPMNTCLGQPLSPQSMCDMLAPLTMDRPFEHNLGPSGIKLDCLAYHHKPSGVPLNRPMTYHRPSDVPHSNWYGAHNAQSCPTPQRHYPPSPSAHQSQSMLMLRTEYLLTHRELDGFTPPHIDYPHTYN